MAAFHFFIFLLALYFSTASAVHNITALLSPFPEYSLYNKYLTETKVADEINTRQTITCLALNNGAMSALANKHPLSVVKSVLSLLVLLDYYDNQKLHDISDGTTLTTTLYQTTGNAPGNFGFVNITNMKGGKVGFGSAAPGSKLDSTYTTSVKQVPYSISILEISAPIIAPGILNAPPPSTALNITALLDKAGCKTFASLILSNGMMKQYQTAAENGLTLFAPNDEAFKAAGVPDLSKLSNAEVVTLLQYHALTSYTPFGSLKTTKHPLPTLASNGAGKYDLTVTTAGDSVTLHTGVASSRVASTVLDSTPFCILKVDDVLLPVELFGKAPSPAPAFEPVAAPSPTPVESPEEAPTPSPFASPPAPPMSPDGAPSDAPADAPVSAAEADSSTPSGAGDLTVTSLVKVLTAAAALLSWSL